MGRGQHTIRDHFSAIFGNRRGTGRPEEEQASREVWTTQPKDLPGEWGPRDFHGGILFLFPRRLSMGTLGEGNEAHIFLQDFYPEITSKLHEPRADGIFVPPEILLGPDVKANLDSYEVGQKLAVHLGFAEDEVVTLVVLQGVSGDKALGRRIT